MTCPNCGATLPDNAEFCSTCGHHITTVASPSPLPPGPSTYIQNQPNFEQAYNRTASAVKNFAWADYFSFRRMITPQIIQVIYIIGAILVTLAGIRTLFMGSDSYYDRGMLGALGFFGGLLILTVGNVAWRLWCEFIIVIFRINSSLSNIDDNTRNRR